MEIGKKTRFQPLGKSKTPIFCVSNPLENQKHPISAFPTPWKIKNTQFLLFQPLGKTKMPRKPPVVGRRNAENNENGLSSADETKNHPQNCVSGHPDEQKLLRYGSKSPLGSERCAIFSTDQKEFPWKKAPRIWIFGKLY